MLIAVPIPSALRVRYSRVLSKVCYSLANISLRCPTKKIEYFTLPFDDPLLLEEMFLTNFCNLRNQG
ncbi:12667_t:CDS:1, partial [Entrophospora sp. SA101]